MIARAPTSVAGGVLSNLFLASSNSLSLASISNVNSSSDKAPWRPRKAEAATRAVAVARRSPAARTRSTMTSRFEVSPRLSSPRAAMSLGCG
jgi:hypothetical protein